MYLSAHNSTPLSSLLTAPRTQLEKAVTREGDRETVPAAEKAAQLREVVWHIGANTHSHI